MNNYTRILPRDAFNEASLLKCIGRITLLIELTALKDFTYKYDNKPFDIHQDTSDGSLFVRNFELYYQGLKLLHYYPLNSRDRYPLMVLYGSEDYKLLNEKGNINKIFKEER